MKKLNIILVLLLSVITLSINAQKVESSVLKKMPVYVLDKGGKVFVKAFENKGEIAPDFGSKFANSIGYSLKNSKNGSGNTKIYNNWYTTNLYEIVSSESDANYIISGDYSITATQSKMANERTIKTKQKYTDGFIIHYYKYTSNVNVNIKGKISVIDANSSSVVHTAPFADSKKINKSMDFHQPPVPNADKLIKNLSSKVITKNGGYYTARYSAKKYSFSKIKANKKSMEKVDFKAYKKELKANKKVLKVLAESGKIKEMGANYLKHAATIEKIKNPEKLYNNIGMCYELIGNFTKAKSYYQKAADKKNMQDIELLIKYQELFKKINLTVEEQEF